MPVRPWSFLSERLAVSSADQANVRGHAAFESPSIDEDGVCYRAARAFRLLMEADCGCGWVGLPCVGSLSNPEHLIFGRDPARA